MGGWGRCRGGRPFAVLVSAALLVTACSGDDDSDSDGDNDDDTAAATTTEPTAESEQDEAAAVFPGAAWDNAEPADVGLDAAVLDTIAAEAQAGGADCMVVVRDGRIAGEWYWNGTDATTMHEAWSATKSYTSTIVGIAQDEGLLDIEDRASQYIPQWVGTPSENVTVRNILSNDSGRRSTDALGGSDPTLLANFIGATDRTGFAVGLDQVAEPGTTWSNNEGAIQNLDPIMEAATGQEPADYARAKLLDPIGAQRTEMTKDQTGNTNMPAFLRTTCADAARLGLLYLRGGSWDGEQIVSEAWVEAATTSSQDLYPGYGLLWWLNADGAQPEAPADTYWALGAFGQIIQVDPGSDTVVVRMGEGDSIGDIPLPTTVRVITDAVPGPGAD